MPHIVQISLTSCFLSEYKRIQHFKTSEVQMVECLPTVYKVLGSIPITAKNKRRKMSLGMVALTCNPSMQEVKPRES